MDVNIFQMIFDAVQDMLPVEWEELFFCAAYEDDSYSMRFYVRKNGIVKQLSQYDGIKQKYVISKAIEIDKFLNKERNALPVEDRWSVLTIVVDNQGKFHADFDYTDISERYFEYMELWEKKFLHNNAANEKPNSLYD